jgi:hypothetical protein
LEKLRAQLPSSRAKKRLAKCRETAKEAGLMIKKIRMEMSREVVKAKDFEM